MMTYRNERVGITSHRILSCRDTSHHTKFTVYEMVVSHRRWIEVHSLKSQTETRPSNRNSNGTTNQSMKTEPRNTPLKPQKTYCIPGRPNQNWQFVTIQTVRYLVQYISTTLYCNIKVAHPSRVEKFCGDGGLFGLFANAFLHRHHLQAHVRTRQTSDVHS